MEKMVHKATVRDFGHFDSAIDLACLEGLEGMKVDNIKPQKFVSSSPWSWCDRAGSRADKNGVYLFPKELDEKVAKLHFPALGTELTFLSQEQSVSTGVKVQGPFELRHGRCGHWKRRVRHRRLQAGV